MLHGIIYSPPPAISKHRSCWKRFDALEDEEIVLNDQLARLAKIRRGERMEVRSAVSRDGGRRAVKECMLI